MTAELELNTRGQQGSEKPRAGRDGAPTGAGSVAGGRRAGERNKTPRLNLARQFGLAAALIILLGMTAIGSWVTSKIEEGVINNSAVAATLYMDAFVAPLVQELRRSETLAEDHKAKLDQIMNLAEVKESIVSIKVWRKGAIVAYSNFPEIIGHQFTPTEHLQDAWQGKVSAELDGHSHDDDLHERKMNIPLLEIYAPIRESGTNRIIAVSEFYVRADPLLNALRVARLQSWGVVAICGVLMIVLLYLIVQRGSNTIDRQRRALELRAMQNAALHEKIERAYWRADHLNEQFLRRLGADLHDGPAQLIGFSLMAIDDLPLDRQRIESDSRANTADSIREALEDALRDIRNLSRGLMLPELDTMTLNETAELIVRMHEERTGTKVDLVLPAETVEAPTEIKVCTYRFIQEALSNAYKHAYGKGQKVEIAYGGETIRIAVSDTGDGFKAPVVNGRSGTHLGLIGIRDRIETLKGRFEVLSPAQGGTVVKAELSCNQPAR